MEESNSGSVNGFSIFLKFKVTLYMDLSIPGIYIHRKLKPLNFMSKYHIFFMKYQVVDIKFTYDRTHCT